MNRMAKTLSLGTRQKISQTLMGRPRPENVKRAISQTRLERQIPNGWLGKHRSSETKAKISETRRRMISEGTLMMPTDKRNPLAKETIEKIRVSNRGQQRSIESRRRMSEAQKRCGNKPPSRKGVKCSEDFRLKCSQRRGEKAPWWGKHHSVETRIKLSELNRGERGSNWQGGITASTENLRHTVEYRVWREAVFARDNYICQECGQRGGRLHPHHIKSFAKYPELRFDINNGITLCGEGHKKTRNFGGRALITPGGQTIY